MSPGSGARWRRWARPVTALVTAVFLVLPSLARLRSLAAGTVSQDPTDIAFFANRGLGALHIVAGLTMVAALPLQHSAGLRQRRPRLHRWAGWSFVVSATLVSLSALQIDRRFAHLGGLSKRLTLNCMALAELVAVSLAMVAIARGRVAVHQRWMLRASGIALAGGAAGLFAVPLFLAGFGPEAVSSVARPAGLLLAMAAVELRLRGGAVRAA
ncbi:MAG: DUF2306 domain-containing protein [Myxococcales bacterium]|nr:DUF2306 domain-containing protein [Myxococcales bacterium]